ncbi:hypothetical protein [Fodinibius sp. SL11]|uniref:hypothetical protein n=1 Tax=Fodinibius sp. SL11 TaxID=3425690 RepID=UPI003F8820C0
MAVGTPPVPDQLFGHRAVVFVHRKIFYPIEGVRHAPNAEGGSIELRINMGVVLVVIRLLDKLANFAWCLGAHPVVKFLGHAGKHLVVMGPLFGSGSFDQGLLAGLLGSFERHIREHVVVLIVEDQWEA